MNSSLVGKVVTILRYLFIFLMITSFTIALITYQVTRIDTIPIEFVKLGMIFAAAAIIVSLFSKKFRNKSIFILAIAIILPLLLALAFAALLGAALRSN